MAKATKQLDGPMVEGRGDSDEPQEYEVKDAADTLMRAEEIKRNKKLMPHVHKHINKKMKSLKDLKRMAVEKDMADDHDEDDMK